MTLKLKFDFKHTHTAQRQLPRRTDDEHAFGPVAQELLDQLWREGTPVRLVGVAISGFDYDAGEQLSLFGTRDEAPEEDAGRKKDLRRLSVATDEVKRKFGSAAISYGRDLRFKDGTSDTMPTGKFDAQ